MHDVIVLLLSCSSGISSVTAPDGLDRQQEDDAIGNQFTCFIIITVQGILVNKTIVRTILWLNDASHLTFYFAVGLLYSKYGRYDMICTK